MSEQNEPIARVLAGVLLHLVTNYWHTIGISQFDAMKLVDRIDAALADAPAVRETNA